MSARDVVIVGAGAIGTAVAWRCAQRGLAVTVVDPDPDRGAWRTAAGMLAPTTELHCTEVPLLQLDLDSLARYPAFVAELEDETGLNVGYLRSGAIAVAWDGADLAALRDLQRFAAGLGVDARLLSGAQLREFEPALASGLPGGLFAPGDHQVDPRLLHRALVACCVARGVRFVTATAAVEVDADRVRGVRLDDGTRLAAGTIVLAAGSWSGQVEGVPREAVPPVRPVKGQTLRLTPPSGLRLRHIVRASVRGSAVYIVPRSDAVRQVASSVPQFRPDHRRRRPTTAGESSIDQPPPPAGKPPVGSRRTSRRSHPNRYGCSGLMNQGYAIRSGWLKPIQLGLAPAGLGQTPIVGFISGRNSNRLRTDVPVRVDRLRST